MGERQQFLNVIVLLLASFPGLHTVQLCKQSKTGAREGLETRLQICVLHAVVLPPSGDTLSDGTQLSDNDTSEQGL